MGGPLRTKDKREPFNVVVGGEKHGWPKWPRHPEGGG